MTRRDALKFSTVAAAAVLGGCSGKSVAQLPVIEHFVPAPEPHEAAAPLHEPRSKRVVIVGGGWSGLSIAKQLSRLAPECDVVLIERRSEFVSGPVSNLWIVGAIGLEFLVHDYLQAARKNGYTFFNATVSHVDKANQTVSTERGEIAYDYLVLAPGVEYDYDRWTTDILLQERLRTEYPAGYIPGSEILSLRSKIFEFKGGTFVMNIPKGNYRAVAAPYERACLIADYFHKVGIEGRVVILDENDAIRVNEAGFRNVFKQRYGGTVDYRPGSEIDSFDLDGRRVRLKNGSDVVFDDASFYPPVRPAALVRNSFDSDAVGFDPLTRQCDAYPEIFVTGDAREGDLARSGQIAYTEGLHVAHALCAMLQSERIELRTLEEVTYSVVGIDPIRAIRHSRTYRYDALAKAFVAAETGYANDWNAEEGVHNGKGLFEWAKGLYADMFGL